MENMVAKLLEDFEQGRMTRRQPMILVGTNTFVIPRNAPPGTTPPRIDHIAYTIENWETNAVKTELERRGLNPRLSVDARSILRR
jgi:hypothetical protein